jgi:pyruvate/2-oxoglutarate/acetoin dehydrogenase E1 component
VCFDGIANELAKYRYMTGGQVTVPVTLRLGNGAGAGFAAQHSQTCENWFLNVPGLKMVVPATAADAYGLMRAAIDDPDPVLYFEHKHLYNHRDAEEAPLETVPLGKAAIVRAGEHATVVASQLMRHRAVAAADVLAREDVAVELIDPRTIAPLDLDAIRESVERTNRLVVVQEAPAAGSWGATVIAALMQESFEMLDAPPLLLACDDTPVPYAESLESAWMPDADRIAEAVRRTIAY